MLFTRTHAHTQVCYAIKRTLSNPSVPETWPSAVDILVSHILIAQKYHQQNKEQQIANNSTATPVSSHAPGLSFKINSDIVTSPTSTIALQQQTITCRRRQCKAVFATIEWQWYFAAGGRIYVIWQRFRLWTVDGWHRVPVCSKYLALFGSNVHTLRSLYHMDPLPCRQNVSTGRTAITRRRQDKVYK